MYFGVLQISCFGFAVAIERVFGVRQAHSSSFGRTRSPAYNRHTKTEIETLTASYILAVFTHTDTDFIQT